ncbi:MAG: poly-beta-1,6 N-acetyl-D-glucosamine export porin PgaA [Methylococcales bacterium]|nr:poly-beta-1,6 N-acetyl-D-glucosamine export porin PgaA [Methylococcales bacterium]
MYLHSSIALSGIDSITHKQDLVKASEGQAEQFLPQLKTMVEKHPKKINYLYDYLQALSWAERDIDIIHEATKIDLNSAPAYIIESIAKATRNLHDYNKAEQLYQLAIQKTPTRLEPKLGLALVFIDQHKTKLAIETLQELTNQYPENINILMSLGSAYEQDDHQALAVELYKKALTIQPTFKEAERRIITASVLNADSHPTMELANAKRTLFTDEQWTKLNWDYATLLIRQGEQALTEKPDGYTITDQAISAINNNIESLKQIKLKDQAVWLTRAEIDLLVAYHDRNNFSAATQLYEHLQEEKENLPLYAKLAAADTYLDKHEPQKAINICLTLIKEQPENFNAHLLLVKAYLESGQTKNVTESLEQVNILVKKYPEEKRYFYNYIQALAWANRDIDVIQLANNFDLNTAPIYVIESIAKAARNLHDFNKAEFLYQLAINKAPHRLESKRGLLIALIASGDIHRAFDMMKTNKDLLSDEQTVKLNWDHAALLVQQGSKALVKTPGNFTLTDHAIDAINLNLILLKQLKLKEPQVWSRRAQADLLLALCNRNQIEKVTELYQKTQLEGAKLPVYVKSAVADTYFKNHQYENTIAIYQSIIKDEPEYFNAYISLARAYLKTKQPDGMTQTLQQLKCLVDKHPEKINYLYDYIQALSWTEQDNEILQLSARLDFTKAPTEVLETMAKSARNMRDFKRAESLYHLALSKAPRSFSARLGISLVLIDQRKIPAAQSYLREMTQDFPENIDIKMALAMSYSLNHQDKDACDTYEKILTIQPENQNARRGLVFALAASGLIKPAITMADTYRFMFSDDQWASLKWDYAAYLIRQGEQALALNPKDYDATDRAIIDIKQNITELNNLEVKNTQFWRELAQADLMVALRERKSFMDVINRYEQLQKQQVILPTYARIAIADAYLNTRQPEIARELYIGVIKDDASNFNAKTSLAYAYLEAEQFTKALALTQSMAEEQPLKLELKQADGSVSFIDNPKKITTEVTAALFKAYTEDIDSAQITLENLNHSYKDNTNIQNRLAEVYYFRGWPNKAQQQIDQVRRITPDSFGLKLVQTKIAHELHHYAEEENLTREMIQYYPEDSGVIKQHKAWQSHNRPELKLYTNGGISSSSTNGPNPFTGSNNISLDSFLYSSPISHNYRIFTHDGWNTGLFKEGQGDLTHYGAGLEYSKNNLLATTELHYDNFKINTLGVDIGLDYQLTDHWQVFSRMSSMDNSIALRALNTGVTAKSIRGGMTYRFNEARKLTVAESYYNYSDGNERNGFDGTYYEQWIRTPSYNFSTFLNAGFSSNKNSIGAYYSPKRDTSILLTLDNDWLTYRQYETAFHQKVAISMGNYWQEQSLSNTINSVQHSNMIGNLQYEHRWQFANEIELSYGAVRGLRYYDGGKTENWQMYLSANVRF